jgi:hypothetical protein
MATHVFRVELYYEGSEVKALEDGPARVEVASNADVYTLKRAVIAECASKLEGCGPGSLRVYIAGTAVPMLPGARALNPGDTVPRTQTSVGRPLIAVALQRGLLLLLL